LIAALAHAHPPWQSVPLATAVQSVSCTHVWSNDDARMVPHSTPASFRKVDADDDVVDPADEALPEPEACVDSDVVQSVVALPLDDDVTPDPLADPCDDDAPARTPVDPLPDALVLRPPLPLPLPLVLPVPSPPSVDVEPPQAATAAIATAATTAPTPPPRG
jgi:hypothetical protein